MVVGMSVVGGWNVGVCGSGCLSGAVRVLWTRVEAPSSYTPAARSPIPWEGACSGDARLHTVVPMLSTNGRVANQSAWPLVSTQ